MSTSSIPYISDLMTAMPASIEAGESIQKAKLLMSARNIRHLPVVEKRRLVGILSDRDIKLAQAISSSKSFDEEIVVGDVMQPSPYVVDGSTLADKVLTHMYKRKIGSALITDGSKLIGIFTATDACRAFAEHLNSCGGKPDKSGGSS